MINPMVAVYIAFSAFALSILVHIIAYAKTWGKWNQVIIDQGKAIVKINKTLFNKDMTPNFVTKREYRDHAKDCPVIICARINDVKNVVEKYVERREEDIAIGIRMQETMKHVTNTLKSQGEVINKVSEDIGAINIHLAELNGKTWDGKERRA